MLYDHVLLMMLEMWLQLLMLLLFFQQFVVADRAEVFVCLDDGRHQPAADVGRHNVHNPEPHQHLVHVDDDLVGKWTESTYPKHKT